jgi:hypothetical protein
VPANTGDAVNELPEAIDAPLQLPRYHFQAPLVPKLPPLTDNVLLLPRQIVEVPKMPVAGTEVSRTVMVAL